MSVAKSVITIQRPGGGGGSSAHPLSGSSNAEIQPPKDQNVNTNEESDPEAEARKRREVLARRPSYRKILNDLSSTEGSSVQSANSQVITKIEGGDVGSSRENSGPLHGSTAGNSYIKLIPGSTIQLAGSASSGSTQTLAGIPALTIANSSGPGSVPTIVQYSGQEGQIFVPVPASDMQPYHIRNNSNPQGIIQMSAPSSHHSGHHHHPDDASKKRELRLLKNREAAKECRRKKKEYIKCLESRVSVLENQNKALINELHSLKELYCQGQKDDMTQ